MSGLTEAPPEPNASASDDVHAGVIEDARRRQRRRRGRLSAALAVIAAAAVAYILSDGGSARHMTGSRPAAPLAASSARTLSGTPIQIASGLGALWILTCQRHCSATPPTHSFGQLFRADSDTGQITERIGVTDPQAFAIDDGALWLIDFYAGTVKRVDPRTGDTTQTISLPLLNRLGPDGRRFLPNSISAGHGAVWVASARGRLAQIDAHSGRVIATVHAPFDATGGVTVGTHATWVAESSLGVGVIEPGASPLKLLAIKARSGQVAVDQLALGGGLVWAYGDIAAGATRNGGGVLTDTARLVTLDQRTGRVVHQLPVANGPYSIAYGDQALFMADWQTGHLFRIDRNYRIHPLHRVRGPGTLIAVTPRAVWATTESGVLHRIAVIPTR